MPVLSRLSPTPSTVVPSMIILFSLSLGIGWGILLFPIGLSFLSVCFISFPFLSVEIISLPFSSVITGSSITTKPQPVSIAIRQVSIRRIANVFLKFIIVLLFIKE